eukprot:PhF_6_TR1402/c0_g1_i2/m.2434
MVWGGDSTTESTDTGRDSDEDSEDLPPNFQLQPHASCARCCGHTQDFASRQALSPQEFVTTENYLQQHPPTYPHALLPTHAASENPFVHHYHPHHDSSHPWSIPTPHLGDYPLPWMHSHSYQQPPPTPSSPPQSTLMYPYQRYLVPFDSNEYWERRQRRFRRFLSRCCSGIRCLLRCHPRYFYATVMSYRNLTEHEYLLLRYHRTDITIALPLRGAHYLIICGNSGFTEKKAGRCSCTFRVDGMTGYKTRIPAPAFLQQKEKSPTHRISEFATVRDVLVFGWWKVMMPFVDNSEVWQEGRGQGGIDLVMMYDGFYSSTERLCNIIDREYY